MTLSSSSVLVLMKNCLTIIHRADYAAAISASGHHFGIRAAISPREATRREIQRFITTDAYTILKKFDCVDLVELRVGKGSIAAGHMVKEVKWPPGIVLVGKLRGLHAELPGPDEVLLGGDHLYAMVSKEAKKSLP